MRFIYSAGDSQAMSWRIGSRLNMSSIRDSSTSLRRPATAPQAGSNVRNRSSRAGGSSGSLYLSTGVSALPHHKKLRSIEILGTHVAPKVREELRSEQTSKASRLVPA